VYAVVYSLIVNTRHTRALNDIGVRSFYASAYPIDGTGGVMFWRCSSVRMCVCPTGLLPTSVKRRPITYAH